jgi:regulator of sirC expression with transglutaminase-like and TPR domain
MHLEPVAAGPDMNAMTITAYGLVDDSEIDLDLAALSLSELDHPGIDVSPYIELLQEIGSRVREVGAHASTAIAQSQALAAVFHGEFGFAGDVASYDVPLNGDLIRVLDRRKGLPVSLSILYVAAARRMGWAAQALNMPGHVMVRIGDAGAVVIDPFNKGALVNHDQMVALLMNAAAAGETVSAENAGPMTNRNVLVRLLMNQASRAERGGDSDRAMTLYRRMTLVAPENPDGWWALARLQLGDGLVDEARRSLSAMLEITREPARRALVTATLEAIAQS